MKEEFATDMAEKLERQRLLQITHKQTKRKQNYD